VKSLLPFFRSVLQDMGDLCGVDTDADFKTVSVRVEQEGDSFLTITLPSFGKALQKALDTGQLVPSAFPSFRFRRGLPVFLRGFLELLFDQEDGRLLDIPSPDAVYALRQITLVLAKIKRPTTPEREHKAFQAYIKCEQSVREYDSQSPFLDEDYLRICSWLFGDLFSFMDKEIFDGNIAPHHGPGSTAERLSSNGKYDSTVWTERLEELFPAREWLNPNHSFAFDIQPHWLEPGAEIPVRVISVPKTLKTPRIIAIEPACMMFIQQSLLGLFETGIAKFDYLAKTVNGPSQVPNQKLALLGSIDSSVSTLDLSEASDRVSNQHVRAIMRRFPSLRDAIDACRSRKADVPGFGVQRLAKFASMGSAVCFPVEALIFLSVVLYGISKSLNRHLTRAEGLKLLRQGNVRVFGDDIIVPSAHTAHVTATLYSFGYRVNADKSFWSGKFRESCGKEYFMGNDVSIVRLNADLPYSHADAQEIERTSATRNLYYRSGMWRTVRYLDSVLEGFIPYPAVGENSPCIGKFSFLGYETQKWDSNLQLPLVRAATVRRITPRDNLDGRGALLKFFIQKGVIPLQDGHLERAGRPGPSMIVTRWVRSY
jgi:hypothetical protein